MKIKKGYVDTSRGQLHIRHVDGVSGPPVILLHWAPGTGRQYRYVMPHLAAAGYAPYAVDLMGFGRSDLRGMAWSIDDFASNLHDAFDTLGFQEVALLGGHFSAAVSSAFAARYPERLSKLILDGSPCWDAPTRQAIAAQVGMEKPAIAQDGSHMTLPWDRAVIALKDWDASFEVTNDSLMDVYRMAIDFLEMGFESPVQAIVAYDMQAVMQTLSLPVLALCAEEEKLRPQHDVVLRSIPHAEGHVFPGHHPMFDPDRAQDYVNVVVQFLRS